MYSTCKSGARILTCFLGFTAQVLVCGSPVLVCGIRFRKREYNANSPILSLGPERARALSSGPQRADPGRVPYILVQRAGPARPSPSVRVIREMAGSSVFYSRSPFSVGRSPKSCTKVRSRCVLRCYISLL